MKYKLPLQLVPLTLLIALFVVWTIKITVSTERTHPSLPGTTETKAEIKGISTVSNKDLNKADLEKVSKLPKFNYTLPLGNGYELSVDVNISSKEEPEKGAYWCGAPFLLRYHGTAKASILNDSGKVEDEINLTAPELVIGKPPDYDYYYYKTYDLDGDGADYEFIVLDYLSCNGNWVKTVKADEKTHRFVALPFRLDGEERDKILTGPNKEDLIFSPARLTTKIYDMTRELFLKREFIYKNGAFVQTSKL